MQAQLVLPVPDALQIFQGPTPVGPALAYLTPSFAPRAFAHTWELVHMEQYMSWCDCLPHKTVGSYRERQMSTFLTLPTAHVL